MGQAHGTSIHIQFDEDAIEELNNVVSECLESILAVSCKLGSLRDSKVLHAKDVSLALKSIFGIVINHPEEREVSSKKQPKQPAPELNIKSENDKRQSPDPASPVPENQQPVVKKRRLRLIKKSQLGT